MEIKIEIKCQVIWMITGLVSLLQQIPVTNHIKTELAFMVIIVLGNSVFSQTLQGIWLIKGQHKFYSKRKRIPLTLWLSIGAFAYSMLEFGPRHKSQIGCPRATNSLQRHFLWPLQYLLKITRKWLSASYTLNLLHKESY